jgi:hypothetical protein
VKEIQKRLGDGADSTDSGLSTPAKGEGVVRQIKIYLANRLARLRGLIRRLHKV